MKIQQALMSPMFLNSQTGLKMPNNTRWQTRHVEALYNPKGFERAIVTMLQGWANYADEVRAKYAIVVGDDSVLGPEWKRAGLAIHALLNGECGRLDCGTLSTFIYATLTSEGF